MLRHMSASSIDIGLSPNRDQRCSWSLEQSRRQARRVHGPPKTVSSNISSLNSCAHRLGLRYLSTRSTAGKIIIELAYGIKVKDTDDPHIESAEHALHALSTSIAPSARIFDLFSMSMSHVKSPRPSTGAYIKLRCGIVIYLPSWFPGASVRLNFIASSYGGMIDYKW